MSSDLNALSVILSRTVAVPALGCSTGTSDAATPSLSLDMSNSATGNLLLDALLLVAVPLVLQFLLSPAGVKEAWHKLHAAVFGNEDDGYVFRDITAVTSFGECQYQDVDDHRLDHLLQKAIMAHLADLLQGKLRGEDVQYEMVDKEIDEDAAQTLEESRREHDYDDDYYSDDDAPLKQYEAINRLRVGSMPVLGKWIEVQPKVFFTKAVGRRGVDDSSERDKDEDTSSKRRNRTRDTTTTLWFKSKAANGGELIDKLIDDAFVKYQLLELAALASDKNKYMYVRTIQLVAVTDDDDSDDDIGGSEPEFEEVVVYKRYVLGEEKTFDNLFFDEKPAL
ncbi:hypothetical protein PybrP1_002032, partial [[Pythium] brassicae (nom. inval.)]